MKVSQNDWRRLYEAALRVEEMAPWEWMEEIDVFGVWPHGRDTAAFVSVMGMLGEYTAVAVYTGPREWHQFLQIQDDPGGGDAAGRIMEVNHLHAAFGQVADLEPPDKKVIRALGLTLRASQLQPYFRSFRPGYFPWFVEAEEVCLLTDALEQLLVIAPLVQNDRALLLAGTKPHSVLTRVQEAPDGPWCHRAHVFPPVATTFRVEVPADLMSEVSAMDESACAVEVDVFPGFMRVGKQSERPQNPYVLLAVEPKSRFVLGVEMLTVETTLEAMWATLPEKLLRMLTKNGIRPSTFSVCTPWVGMVLDSVCSALNTKLQRKAHLPALDRVRRDFEQQFLQADQR